MNMYLITTKNGTYISIGNKETEAKTNFTLEFPSEKIREIEELEGKALQVLILS